MSSAEIKKLSETLKLMKEKSSKDPIYFFNAFLYTYNPKVKDGETPHLRFKTFPFQNRLIIEIIDAMRKGNDLFIEKCREMGATYTTLGVFIWLWLFEPGTNILLGSRKEDYVDNRRGSSSGNKDESLFGKIDYMLERLPQFLLPEGYNKDRNFTNMSLINPENGNVISGESANPNFSRGGRFRIIMLDEFAFWDFGEAVWGSTADTTNCRIILTTPGIKPSKAKRLRFGKDGEKIKVITLTYDMDPRKTKKWLDQQRERRSSEDFSREIMINWELSITGRVYPEIDNASVGDFPFMQMEPLYCSWDFGLDGVAFIFWQFNKSNGRWRMIDGYTNDDKPMPFYLPFFGKPIGSEFNYTDDDLKAINQINQYPKATHFGDPDVKKRSILTGTSTKQLLSKAGIYVNCISKNDFYSRREKTKIYLGQGIEINNNPRTDYIREAINASRYPERQETSQATTPVALPIHDWSSHPRSAMEYFFVNIDNYKNITQEKPDWASQTKRWLTSRYSVRR